MLSATPRTLNAANIAKNAPPSSCVPPNAVNRTGSTVPEVRGERYQGGTEAVEPCTEGHEEVALSQSVGEVTDVALGQRLRQFSAGHYPADGERGDAELGARVDGEEDDHGHLADAEGERKVTSARTIGLARSVRNVSTPPASSGSFRPPGFVRRNHQTRDERPDGDARENDVGERKAVREQEVPPTTSPASDEMAPNWL